MDVKRFEINIFVLHYSLLVLKLKFELYNSFTSRFEKFNLYSNSKQAVRYILVSF